MAQLLEDGQEMPQIEIKDLNRLTPNDKIANVIGGYLPFVGYRSTPAVLAKSVRTMRPSSVAATLHNGSTAEVTPEVSNEDSDSLSSFDCRSNDVSPTWLLPLWHASVAAACAT